jgi:hypothetical protein
MGHWRKFFEEKYLVEIERLQIEEVYNPDTNTKDNKLVLHFKGKKKGMVCNKTNARSIAALYGDDADKWRGKRITLYAKTVTVGRNDCRAIRVREQVPQQAPQPQSQQPPHDPETGEVLDAHEPQPERGASSKDPVSY